MSVRNATPSDLAHWDERLQAAVPNPHILQSRSWGEFKATQSWTPHSFVSQEGEEILPILGLSRKLPFTPWKILYFPKLVLPQKTNLAHLDALFSFTREQWGNQEGIGVIKLELEHEDRLGSLQGWLERAQFKKSATHPQFKRTMWIDLGRNKEDLLQSFKSKTRYNIRLSGKKGVQFAAANDEAGLDRFLALYRSTSQRQHFPMRRLAYYKALWKQFFSHGQATLLLATHDEELLAGVLLWRFGSRGYYLYGASGVNKRNLMPTYGLQWSAMQWAKTQGATIYDMVGLPEEPDKSDPFYGVYQFKLGFQGEAKNWLGAYDLVTQPILQSRWPKLESLLKRMYWYLKKDTFY